MQNLIYYPKANSSLNSVLFKLTMSIRFLSETLFQILLSLFVPLARGQQTGQQIKTVLCYVTGTAES